MKLKYAYCIVNCAAKKSFGKIGMGGGEVYTIPYRDISAVVSDIVADESMSNPFDLIEPGEENWLKHEEVIGRAMREHTVIPIKFLSVLKNEYDLIRMLGVLYRECVTELIKFKNKAEVGVKIHLDGKNIKREIEAKRMEIKRLREDLSRKANLMIRRRIDLLGEATRMLLDVEEVNPNPDEYAVKIYYAEEFYEKLKSYAAEAHANPLIDKDMILNGSFLISKDRIKEFRKNLATIRRSYRNRGFRFLFSGPWAPYNFTKIKYY